MEASSTAASRCSSWPDLLEILKRFLILMQKAPFFRGSLEKSSTSGTHRPKSAARPLEMVPGGRRYCTGPPCWDFLGNALALAPGFTLDLDGIDVVNNPDTDGGIQRAYRSSCRSLASYWEQKIVDAIADHWRTRCKYSASCN